MPIYEYVCPTCGRMSELLQKSDDPPPTCGNCETVGAECEMVKQMSQGSFILKGKGWYKTDYPSKK